MSYEKVSVIEKDGKRFIKINFALFPNQKRGEKDPTAKYWDKETGISAAAWTKDKDGSRYMSCNVEIPVDSLPMLAHMDPPRDARPELNDDIPFN